MEELQARHPNRFKLWFTLDHPPEGTVPIPDQGSPFRGFWAQGKPLPLPASECTDTAVPWTLPCVTGGGRAGCPADQWVLLQLEAFSGAKPEHPPPAHTAPRGQRGSGRCALLSPCRLGLQQGLRLRGHDPGAPARSRGGRAAAALWATPDGAAGLPPQPGQTGLLAKDALHLLSLPALPWPCGWPLPPVSTQRP